MKIVFHFVIRIFRMINDRMSIWYYEEVFTVKSQKCILVIMLMTTKCGILYTEHEGNDREDMEVKPKERTRTSRGKEDVRKNGG